MKKKRGNFLTIIIYLVILAVLVVFVTTGNDMLNKNPDELQFDTLFALIAEGMGEDLGSENSKVHSVQITQETLYGLYQREDLTDDNISRFEKGKYYDFYVTVGSADAFTSEMARLVAQKYSTPDAPISGDSVTVGNYGFKYKVNPQPTTPWYLLILPYVFLIGGVILLFVMMNRANGGKQAANFGRSRAKTAEEVGNTVTFSDVAGADEEKQELREMVDFLRSPKEFTEMGARIPKGVLLVGPPGTGKTLLAKAVAGEANVPFFSISSSEFVELYVGVGASRVRDMFTTAKRCAPAIIFIDEIDAVGRKRGAGVGGGHDEREQTLNQLLVEMDGFSNTQGIIVIAATNRPDVLDPALLRAGRFDRRVTVNYPDVKGRKEILEVHARKKQFSSEVDMEKVAKLTPGCTGADLENILNESAILAVRDKRNKITPKDIDESIKRVLYGPEKKTRVITKEDMYTTAVHEVGHAAVAHCLPKCDPVHELSIIPRGLAAGYTRMLPQDTYAHVSKGKLMDEIACFLGGRAAEMLLLDDISTGASNDLMRATEIARSIVVEYGMSDAIGPVYLAGGQEVFLGQSLTHQQNFSEDVAAKVDTEVRRILEAQIKRAEQVIDEHRAEIERVVNALVKEEQLTGDEFKQLFDGNTVSPAPEA